MDEERAILSALVARLLPLGPGTPESVAPVVGHIQEVLRGPHFATAGDRLQPALRRLDELSGEHQGDRFAALDPARQTDVLERLEREGADGSEAAALLFRLLVPLVLEASLRSPRRGGEPARRGREHMGLGEEDGGRSAEAPEVEASCRRG